MKFLIKFLILLMMSFSLSLSSSLGQVASAATPEELEPSYKGGTLKVRLGAWPKGLNYHIVGDVYTGMMWKLVGISLVGKSMEDFSNQPFLASKWTVGKDKKTYTFYLNKEATWFDGKPITADDVKFTFDLVYDEKRCVLCAPNRGYMGAMEYIKKIDNSTVEIKMKNIHFDTISRLGEVPLLPKHKYSKGSFDKDYNKVMWGGGPYVYDKKGSKFKKTVVFKRRKNYWANKYPYIREQYNFNKVIFKHIKDTTVAFEAYKRKDIDVFYYSGDSYKMWDEKTKAPFTDKNNGVVVAEKYNPSSWGGVALNMRKGILSDKKVRKALQFMFNRNLVAKKVYNNHLTPVAGPFMRGGKYSSNSKAIPFNIKKAGVLLKEAGFTKAGPDGYLYREHKGKKEKASITIMYSRDTHSKWLTVWKEDAKKAGFEIVPRFIEWSAVTKLLDDYKFQAFVIGWAGDPVPAPNQLFHGRGVDKSGGSNYPGLNSAKLNKLIEKGPAEFNEKKRISLYKQIEKMIIDEQPYVFFLTGKQHYVTYWKDKVDATNTPYRKFNGSPERHSFFLHWRAKKK